MFMPFSGICFSNSPNYDTDSEDTPESFSHEEDDARRAPEEE
jgi:hypothetical protein